MMQKQILHIEMNRLHNLIAKAYRCGMNGYGELAEDVAKKLVQDCIKEIQEENTQTIASLMKNEDLVKKMGEMARDAIFQNNRPAKRAPLNPRDALAASSEAFEDVAPAPEPDNHFAKSAPPIGTFDSSGAIYYNSSADSANL